MAVRGQDITSVIRRQIQDFGGEVTMVDVGTVVEVGDGIARVQGLAGCRYTELLQLPGDIMGIALNLEEDSVGVVLLGDDSQIKEGDEVRSTGRIVEAPVGDGLLGRVVDALGRPIDGKGATTLGQEPAGRARGPQRGYAEVGRRPGADRHQGH